MTLEWRQRRIARNETSFRDINERLQAGLEHVRHVPELLDFICECGDRNCEGTVQLTREEYEQVRQDSRWFAVLPGHVFAETERVVNANARYEIVEKYGAAVEVTDAADHRALGIDGRRSDSAP